jgi:peptidoglycan hydrolase CwlO-like protein
LDPGAIDAQGKTIAALQAFIQGLQTVLNATDTPKMLERFENYKKIVDLETDAIKQRFEAYKKTVDEETDAIRTQLEALTQKAVKGLEALEALEVTKGLRDELVSRHPEKKK